MRKIQYSNMKFSDLRGFSCFFRHFSLLMWFTIFVCGVFASCFKDEPLNAECDIEAVYVHVDHPEELFFSASDTLVNVLYSDDKVIFRVRRGADLTSLAPRFQITEGARIEPQSGSVQDFSQGPVIYQVTSESGEWNRRYEVSFQVVTRTVNDTVKYDFERFYLKSDKEKYYVWNDLNPDGSEANNWATGNGGFYLVKSKSEPSAYPSTVVEDGVTGYAAKLTTSDTGPLGKLRNMAVAAGNLFIGRFDVQNALTNAMKATQFGLPFDKKPVRIEGYYKYQPGENFQDRDGNILSGVTDKATIYAVLYRNKDAEGRPIVLYGDNVQTSDQVVALAKLKDISATSEWTKFDVAFNYNEEINQEMLENYDYSLTVVFSSSINGNLFEGAIGSTLWVDEVRVVCLKIE